MARTAKDARRQKEYRDLCKRVRRAAKKTKKMAKWGDEGTGRRHEMTPAQKLLQEDETTN